MCGGRRARGSRTRAATRRRGPDAGRPQGGQHLRPRRRSRAAARRRRTGRASAAAKPHSAQGRSSTQVQSLVSGTTSPALMGPDPATGTKRDTSGTGFRRRPAEPHSRRAASTGLDAPRRSCACSGRCPSPSAASRARCRHLLPAPSSRCWLSTPAASSRSTGCSTSCGARTGPSRGRAPCTPTSRACAARSATPSSSSRAGLRHRSGSGAGRPATCSSCPTARSTSGASRGCSTLLAAGSPPTPAARSTCSTKRSPWSPGRRWSTSSTLLGPAAEAEARRLGELVLDAREARVEALLGDRTGRRGRRATPSGCSPSTRCARASPACGCSPSTAPDGRPRR